MNRVMGIILFVVSISLLIVTTSLFLQTRKNMKIEKELDRKGVIIHGNALKIDSLKSKGLGLEAKIDSLIVVINKFHNIEKKEAK